MLKFMLFNFTGPLLTLQGSSAAYSVTITLQILIFELPFFVNNGQTSFIANKPDHHSRTKEDVVTMYDAENLQNDIQNSRTNQMKD